MAITLRRYIDPRSFGAAQSALDLQPWDVTRMAEPLARELGLRNG